LSWDEIARSSQAVGYYNTLPLELQGQTTTVTTPVIYALGTLTTSVSLLIIAGALAAISLLRKRQREGATVAPETVVKAIG
jgi:putative spermidine/putrescine transport system permease protein